MIGDASSAGCETARKSTIYSPPKTPPRPAATKSKIVPTTKMSTQRRRSKIDPFVLGEDEVELNPIYKMSDVYVHNGYERVLITVEAPHDFTGDENTYNVDFKGRQMKIRFHGGLFALWDYTIYSHHLLTALKVQT